jgi:hypothetical protein
MYALGAAVLALSIVVGVVAYYEEISIGNPPSPLRRMFLPSSGSFRGLEIQLPNHLVLDKNGDRLSIWRRFPAFRTIHTGSLLQLRYSDSPTFTEIWANKDSACGTSNGGCLLTLDTTTSGFPFICQVRLRPGEAVAASTTLTTCHLDRAQISLLLSCAGDGCSEFTPLPEGILKSYRPK